MVVWREVERAIQFNRNKGKRESWHTIDFLTSPHFLPSRPLAHGTVSDTFILDFSLGESSPESLPQTNPEVCLFLS